MNDNPTLILFEYPLTERVRSYLRLDFLFHRFHHNLNQDDADAHHLALSVLFEIMECATRIELKTDILQELDRQKQVIEHCSDCANDTADEIRQCIDALHSVQQRFGQSLRENDWLMSVRQRINISGATSSVDFPSYYYWLNMPPDTRRNFLHQCSSLLLPTGNAIALLLRLLRQKPQQYDCIANLGSFQQSELDREIQLVQIYVNPNLAVIPEVSANKYLMHIRFVTIDFVHSRGKKVDADIPFKLELCHFES